MKKNTRIFRIKKFKKVVSEKAPELAKSSSTESVTNKVDKIKIESKVEEKAQKMPSGQVERTPPALWVEKYKPASMGKIVGQESGLQ